MIIRVWKQFVILVLLIYIVPSEVAIAGAESCNGTKITFVEDGWVNVFNGKAAQQFLIKKGTATCLSPNSTLKLEDGEVIPVRQLNIMLRDGCRSHYVHSWPSGSMTCLVPEQIVPIVPGAVWTELRGLHFGNTPPPEGKILSQARSPLNNCTGAGGTRGMVMKKFNITCDGADKYNVPPITDHSITLSERLEVIEMLALSEGIPPVLLKAICWQEGWDRFTGGRCENWYKNGQVITSGDGNGLCAFQITLRWHPESDVSKLRTDFTYCVKEGIRILVGLGKPNSQEVTAWERNVRRYGDGNNGSYWPIVLSHAQRQPWK